MDQGKAIEEGGEKSNWGSSLGEKYFNLRGGEIHEKSTFGKTLFAREKKHWKGQRGGERQWEKGK